MACGTANAADPTAVAAGRRRNRVGRAGSRRVGDVAGAQPDRQLPAASGAGEPGCGSTSLFGWAFTPIFQGLFVLLALLYALTGNIIVAIVVMTLMIRLVTIRLSARQIVSQQRMQMLAPELRELTKELQRRYKGDRVAIQQATQEFYKERGVSPTAGCLPCLLQMGLLFPMYWVIRDRTDQLRPERDAARLRREGRAPRSMPCRGPRHRRARQGPAVHQHRHLGIDIGQAQVLFNLPLIVFTLGVSAPGCAAGLMQFVQSRMLMPPAVENDPSASTQRR